MDLNRRFCHSMHRVDAVTPCPVPATGPAIVVCNHISHIDPAMIQSGCPQRVIQWMMTREFYDLPMLGRLFRLVQAIPVKPSGKDMAAMRTALRALEDGRVVGIFPEGRISREGGLLPMQTGVALMAIRAGVPVYPVGLDGTQRNSSFWEACLSPQRACLAFGEAVQFERSGADRHTIHAATDAIRDAVQDLMETAARACRAAV
jgi:1-acyl-sn-glycerol-3-phosphate acyltransferase